MGSIVDQDELVNFVKYSAPPLFFSQQDLFEIVSAYAFFHLSALRRMGEVRAAELAKLARNWLL